MDISAIPAGNQGKAAQALPDTRPQNDVPADAAPFAQELGKALRAGGSHTVQSKASGTQHRHDKNQPSDTRHPGSQQPANLAAAYAPPAGPMPAQPKITAGDGKASGTPDGSARDVATAAARAQQTAARNDPPMQDAGAATDAIPTEQQIQNFAQLGGNQSIAEAVTKPPAEGIAQDSTKSTATSKQAANTSDGTAPGPSQEEAHVQGTVRALKDTGAKPLSGSSAAPDAAKVAKQAVPLPASAPAAAANWIAQKLQPGDVKSSQPGAAPAEKASGNQAPSAAANWIAQKLQPGDVRSSQPGAVPVKKASGDQAPAPNAGSVADSKNPEAGVHGPFAASTSANLASSHQNSQDGAPGKEAGKDSSPPASRTSPAGDLMSGALAQSTHASIAPHGVTTATTGTSPHPASAAAPSHALYAGLQAAETAQARLNDAVKHAQMIQKPGAVEMRVNVRSDVLGPVQLRAVVREGTLGATIGVATPETHALLSKELPGLQVALNDHHLHMGNITVIQEQQPAAGSSPSGGFNSNTPGFAQPRERPMPARLSGAASPPPTGASEASTPNEPGRLSIHA